LHDHGREPLVQPHCCMESIPALAYRCSPGQGGGTTGNALQAGYHRRRDRADDSRRRSADSGPSSPVGGPHRDIRGAERALPAAVIVVRVRHGSGDPVPLPGAPDGGISRCASHLPRTSAANLTRACLKTYRKNEISTVLTRPTNSTHTVSSCVGKAQ